MSEAGVDRVRALLATQAGADELLTAPTELRSAACDALHVGTPPRAILAPRSVATLVATIPRIVSAGLAIVPRGAALSYSAGAVCATDDWLAIDLRRLDRVLAVDAVDRRVRVEAGCTWSALHGALAARGLRTPFWGPASGLHATIGGALANDAIFYGSARHGTFGATVLGATVLLADGRLLGTGAHAVAGAPSALPFGPDLTRLFVGACGALGIVVEVTLPLEPAPAATRHAGFRCATAAIALDCLAALGAGGDATEAIVLDPAVTTRIDGRTPQDLGVPGRTADPASPFLLSLSIDAGSVAEADLRLARATAACIARGASTDGEGLLPAFREHPFQPPTMLRGAGRRWVPVHGIVPHSRALAALDALDSAMRAHAAAVAALGLEWSATCAAVGSGAVLVEANLTWPDQSNALIDEYLGAAVPAVPGGEPARWTQVNAVRRALAEALAAVGATHLQIGRFYDYADRLDGPARAIVQSLKRLFDPRGMMNPGVLGLDTQKDAMTHTDGAHALDGARG